MTDIPSLNPYESPHALAHVKQADERRQPRRTVAVWTATWIVLLACLAVAISSGYVVLMWFGARVPGLAPWLPMGRSYAPIAAGAANVFIMACAISFGQIRATFYFDSIWARTIAWLLLIDAVVLLLGAVLLDIDSGVERWLFWPALVSLALGICMYSWCNRLFAAKMQNRRRLSRTRSVGEENREADGIPR